MTQTEVTQFGIEDPVRVDENENKPPIAHLVCFRCYFKKKINPLTSPCGQVSDRSNRILNGLPFVACAVCAEAERDHWKCPMCGARF
jgi:ribosomal protein L32